MRMIEKSDIIIKYAPSLTKKSFRFQWRRGINASRSGENMKESYDITDNVHPFMHSTTPTSFKNYDTFASKSFNVLTEFQLGLFRSKENRLYIIGYPLSAPMMRINVSLESDSLEK